MKDIHTALKSIMEKTKVIAQRTNNLEHDAAVQRRDWEDKINDVSKSARLDSTCMYNFIFTRDY